MTVKFSQPDAVTCIKAANLKPGSWGGTQAVCMMSALVKGARSTRDCVTAGWPEWLVDINVYLFDMGDNDLTRNQFALDVAIAIQTPRDMDKALNLFLILTLERSKAHDTANVTQPIIDLLHRRIAGEDVRREMLAAANEAANAAANDANADANDAVWAAARAAYAANAAANDHHAAAVVSAMGVV